MGSGGPFEGTAPSLKLSVPSASTVGKYRLLAELGSGGMANVYLAVMRGKKDFNKLVVLKIPREAVAEDPSLLAMFLDEARLAARLNHRNVVQTYEVVEESGRDVIVMEYLDGQTLNEILVRARRVNTPVPFHLHLRIIIEALNGLHYAHELKDFDGRPLELVHRDVSPHNIFVTFDGEVKVLDFGIAKAAISSHVTQAGTFKGKIRYMPPEQFAVEGVDRRADVFALGAVLWEAVVGKKLWTGTTDSDVISNVVAGSIPMPRDVKPDVDERLDAIVRRALAHDKEARYDSCRALKEDLEDYVRTVESASLNDVSTYVSMLFAETRSERTHLIEEQLARIGANKDRLFEGDDSSIAGDAPSGQRPIAPSSLGEMTPLETPAPLGFPKAAAPSPEAPAPAAQSRGRAIALALVAVVVAVTAVTAVRFGRHATQTVAPSTPPPAEIAQAPVVASAASVASEVTISMAARPADARLFLDDHELPSNPYVKAFPKGGSLHTLRIEAKDHDPQTMSVLFDSDKELVITLDRSAPAAPTSRVVRPSTPTRGHAPSAGSPSPRPSTATAPPEVKPEISAPPPEVKPPSGTPKRPERHIDDKL
jgi:serine/threonine protein kinase